MTHPEHQHQPKGILDHLVSVFLGAKTHDVTETVPLGDVLHRIQDGTYRATLAHVREQKSRGKAAYRKAKEQLLAFTPCCALHTRDKAVPWSAKLISPTGLVHYDFDHVPDAPALKERLAANPATVFAFISPGGDGVKVGIAAEGITNVDTYKHPWHVVLRRLKKAYPALHISEDEHVKFLHALCFVSHDPALYVNAQAVPLTLSSQAPDEEAPFPEPVAPAEAESAPDYTTVVQALPHIPCEHYDTWWRVGLSLKRGGQPWARSLWDGWSQQSTKYNHASQQKKWDDFPVDGAIHPYSVLTIAVEHGWRPAGWGQEQAEGITSHLLRSAGEDEDPHEIKASAITSISSLTSQPARVARWPVLLPEARHGLAGDYVQAIEEHSEADPVALLVQFLTEFGVVAGRHSYGQVGDTQHYGNLFAVIVGRTARSRKGTSYNHIAAQMHTADPTWSRHHLIKGVGSGEGLVYAVRDKRMGREPIKDKGRIVEYQEVELDPGVEDKRALYMTGEFSSVLKVASREGNILSETLRDIWDTGYLRCTTKQNPLTATDAHIGIIGHITIDEIRKLMTSIDMANGFAHRFLWLCAQRSKELPEGGHLSSVNF